MRPAKSLTRFAMLAFLTLACGKDRQEAPSNREGYTDGPVIAESDPSPPKEGETPAPTVDGVSNASGFVVEVEVFQSEEAALRLSRELRDARITNDVQQLGEKKFRVVVGKAGSRERAEKMLDRVVRAGFKTARVAPAASS